MNRIFRLVWNETLGAWVAVSEKAKARGKRSARAVALLAPMMATVGLLPPAQAGPPAATQLPTGATVTAGVAAIVPGAAPGSAVLNINQTTQRASINWETFNLGSAAQVNFNQPNSSSATLNRVLDSNPSQIMGKITANGQVFLSNPNGVYFGKTASVDVGGLTATTHAISDADFMAGKLTFTRNGATGSVINEGTLRAALGGYIALLAPEVRNEGVILARMGSVAMAAGESVTLNFDGANTLAGITVKASAIRALVENKGAVLAPGGMIVLSARALDRLQGGVVKNSGRLEATGLAMKGGRIVLEASDKIDNSGTISANAGADGSPAGSVTLAAPAIVNSGAISAAAPAAAGLAPATGGSIALDAETIVQTAGAALDVSGASGGKVALQASADITLAGTIAADGAEGQGGSVTLAAAHDVTLQDALVDASGSAGGGQILVAGGSQAPLNPPDAPNDRPTVALLGATELRSSSRRGRGGAISLTADRVGLFGTSSLDASGATGGGDVRVGGGFHGQDASIANAGQVAFGAHASIDASATEVGDGGTVVVWSDGQTAFDGKIAAHAGQAGGDGGQIEVSGKQGVAFRGSVDAGAAHGKAGSVLLDPHNLTIDSAGVSTADLTTVDQFADTPATDSVISADTITAITNTGAAVILQANNDIVLNSSIVSNNPTGNGGNLTFNAGRSITLNGSIISDNGAITFTVNDAAATGANRDTGTASFTNYGLIDARAGAVSITMGSGNTSGAINAGQVTAATYTVAHNGASGTAADGQIDLGGTTISGNMTIASSAARNIVNTVGNVVVLGSTGINVGTGDVTISRAATDFNTIGLIAGNVVLSDINALKLSATTTTGALSVTTFGPIANTGAVTVAGAASFIANDGGFSNSDPYIKLDNAGNDFQGPVTLSVASAGGSATGGYATVVDKNAIDVASASTNKYFNLNAVGAITTGALQVGTDLTVNSSTSGDITMDHTTVSGTANLSGKAAVSLGVSVVNGALNVTGKGAVNLDTTTANSLNINNTGTVNLGTTTVGSDMAITTTGQITDSGDVKVARYTTLSAGATNDITLDSAGNDFSSMQIASGKNVTLLDSTALQFGHGDGYAPSTVSGTLAVTAGGTINEYRNNENYAPLLVTGAASFTVTAANSDLLLGPNLDTYISNNGYQGAANSFASTVTTATSGVGTFRDVSLRNTSASAGLISGLSSGLRDVVFYYDAAPTLMLPAMTLTGNLLAQVPQGSISQSGPLVVNNIVTANKGQSTFGTSGTGDITLTDPGNDFNHLTINTAHDASIVDANAIDLYASTSYFNVSRNLTVTAAGAISDSSINGNLGYYMNVGSAGSGTATLTAGSGNDIILDNDQNFWKTVVVPSAKNFTLNQRNSVVLGNVNTSGTLTIDSRDGGALTQLASTAVTAGAGTTTTFTDFTTGITLSQPGNVLGDLVIGNTGAVNIRENDAITQASAWGFTGTNGGNNSNRWPVTLATSNEQPIMLGQAGNVFGDLTITQYNNGATSFGAVYVRETGDSYFGMTEGSAWTVHGTTKIDGGAYSVNLNNANNVFGPLQVLGATGLTNNLASSVTLYAKTNGASAAITDVGAGDWAAGTGAGASVKLVAYDSTGLVAGGGNINLANLGNVLGDLYIKAASATITEADSITDGIAAGGWNAAGDIGWATTGTTSLIVANPAGKSITLDNLSNKLGALSVSTAGTPGTLSSVLLTDNTDLTQASAWLLGTAPVTLDARINKIDLSTSGNVLGAVTINPTNGTPSAVALTENDAIDQAGLWNLPGASVKLIAENGNAVRLGSYDNVFGNVAITGGIVSLRENANIVQDPTSAGDWHTTGLTTLSIASGHNHNFLINLRNASNTFGPLAILGTSDGASYPESVALAAQGDITQASPWRLQLVSAGVDTVYTPVTLTATNNVTLTQADNQIGRLTISAQNATVVENKTIEDGGIGWRVPGLTTLTAQNSTTPATGYDINMVGTDNDFGSVKVISGAKVSVTDKNAIVIAGAAVDASTGLLTVTAGGEITQSAAITGDGILLSGAGFATLNGPGNYIDNVAANFTGGDLNYTGAADFSVSSSTGISIGAHKVALTSTNGAVSQLLRVSGSSAGLDVNTFAPLTVPNTVSIAGYQTYTSAGGITLSGTMTSTAAGAITFNSPVTLGGAMQINNTSASTDSAVQFMSTVDGAGYTLGVRTKGPVDFMNTVGNVGASGTTTLLLQGSGTTTFHSTLGTNDGVSVAGPLVLQDSVTIGHGAQASIFGGLVTLGKAGGMDISGYNNLSFNGGLQLQAGPSTITSHDSTITLAGAVSGPYGLTLNAGQQNIIGISNIGPDITSLNATAGTIIIPGSFSIAGPQTYNAAGITLGGTLSSSAAGAITFNSPVVLNAASSVNSVDSNVVFGDIVNGSFNLGVNAGTGTVSFARAVGHISKLGSGSGAALALGGTGATSFLDTLETNAGISALGATSFGANVTLGNGDTGSSLGGLATLGGNIFSGYDGLALNGGLTLTGDASLLSNGSTLSFGNTVSGAHALTLNALSGNAGDVTGLQWLNPALTGLSVTAYTLSLPQAGFAVSGPMDFTATGGITLNGNVGNTTSTGQIDFKSPVTLATGASQVATHNAAINFADTVTGAQNLTLNAGSGAVNFAKAVSNLGSGTGAALTLAGSGTTTFGASLAANSGLLASGGGNLIFQNDASFANGDTGSDFGLGTLTMGRSGATTNLSGYRGLTFRGAVVLTGGPVAIDSNDGNVSVLGALNGAVNLSLDAGTGSTSFAAPVGQATPLGTGTGAALKLLSTGLTTFGSTLDTASGISAAGPVVFAGDVTLGNGSVGSNFSGAVTLQGPGTGTLDFSGRNGIAFGGAVNLAGGASVVNSNNSALAFNSTVEGGQVLTVNAGNDTVVFGGAVGAGTALAALDVSANSISLPQVTTSGNQTYAAGTNASGTIALHGDLTTTGAGNLSISGRTTITGDTQISTGGSVNFNTSSSTIDGAFNLGINAGGTGNVVLGGQLGQTVALNNVTVAGNNLSLPNINATGVQSYTAQHDITLVQSRTAGNDVSFSAGAAGDGTGALILPTGISLNVTNHALTVSAADLQMNGTSSMSTGSGLLTIAGVPGNDIYLGGSPATVAGQMNISGDELQRISTSGGLLLQTSGTGKITVDGITQAQSQNVSGALQLKAQGTGAIGFQGGASTFNAVTVDAASGFTNVAVNLSTTNDPIDFKSKVAVAGASTINSGGGDITFENTLAVDNDLTLSTGNGVLSFLGAVGSNKTLTLNLGGGRVDGLGQLQSALTGLTVNSSSGITLPTFTINGPQVYNTGVITATGNLGGVGISFNNLVDVVPASGTALTLNAGSGTLNFGNLVSFNGNDMTLTGDEINFTRAVTGSGSLLLQPFTASRNVAVNGSGAPIAGLNFTAAEMSLLPVGTLTGLTIGSTTGTGTLNLAGPLSFAARPLTLNGGGGISQSGALTSGDLTLYAAGSPIILTNANNAFGAVAFNGTPSSVSLVNSLDIVQLGAAAWNLGNAAVTLNAGSHNVTLLNAGNTFGTLGLTGHTVQLNEAGATDFGASTVDSLTSVSTGPVSTSGKLAVAGLADLKTLNDSGAGIALDDASTFGSVKAVSRNAADMTPASGNIALAPGASTLIKLLETTGNITLTAAAGTTLSEDGASVLKANGLELLGAGTHALALGANDITTLAGNTGTVILTENSGFDIGTVNGIIGLIAAGNMTLSSSASVTQSQGMAAAGLELLGTGGSYTLDNPGNAIGTVAGNTGTVKLTGNGGIDIGTVNTAGLSTSGDLTLSSTGNVTQSQKIAASGLELLGAGGNFVLNNGANAITTLAGATGTVKLTDNSGFDIGTVNTAGMSASANLSLSSTGSVTQSQAIAAGGLELLGAGGSYTLNNGANAFTTVAGNTGTASLTENSGFSIGTVNTVGLATSGNLTLSSTASVTQADAISAAGLELLGTGGNFTLTNSANALTTVAGNTGTVSLTENSGFDVGTVNTAGLATSGDLTLSSNANVTQSARIAAAGLDLLGSTGSFALTNAGNAITTLAGNTGSVSLVDNSGFTIASVGSTVGVTTSGNLSLSSAASVTQSQAIAASGLELLGATGDYTLDHAGNALTTVAGNTGTVKLTENGGVDIGTVNASVGLTTTSNLSLTSTGNVTQSQKIAAGGLELLGAGGNFALNNGANALTTLAANTGSVALTENSGFDLGTVNTAGVTTSGNLSLNSTGTVTQSHAITASGLELLGTGGNFALSDDANVLPVLAGNTGSANVHTAGALEVGTVNSNGMATTGNLQLKAGSVISQTQALAIGGDLTLQTTHHAGDVAITNTEDTALGATSIGGDYTLTATGKEVTQRANTDLQVRGDLTITAASLVASGAGNLFGGTNAIPGVSELRASGVITLDDVNQAGNYSVVSVASSKTYAGPAVHGTAISLDNPANAIGGALNVTTVGPAVNVGGEVQTGIVQSPGSHISIAGIATFTAEGSSVAGSGMITLNNPGNSFGSLVLTGTDVSVTESTGSTDIRSAVATGGLAINSAAGVLQSGPIVTPQLAVTAAGAVTLTHADNDVAKLAINANGAISYRDANGFEIASVAGVNGIDTTSGAAVTLTAGGAGDITQTQAIHNASTLAASAGGSVLLGIAGNAIDTLGAVSAGTGIDINDATGGLTMGGNLASASGNIEVHTEGGDLTLADGNTVGVGSGNVYLAAGVGFNFKNAWTNPLINPISVGSGRYLIYTTNNAATQLGGITGAGYMGYSFAANAPGSVAGPDSRIMYNDVATLVFTATSQSRLYGDANPTLVYTVSGFLPGDDINTAFGGMPNLTTLLLQNSNVGSGAISIALGGVNSSKGYAFSFVDGLLTITPRPISLSGTRAYDGSVNVDAGMFSASNTYNGETLNLGGAGTVGGKDVGTNKAVTTIGLTLANGTGLASNYTLTGGTYSADITRKTVALSASKTYDGSLALAGAVSVATGVSGESLSYTGATGNDANVATAGKYIDAIVLGDGSGLAGNYKLPTLDAAHAALTITPKTVAISATKTYDGNTALDGKVAIDTGIAGQALNYSGAIASDAHVATAGKYIDAITLADGLGGVASNYRLPLLTAAGSANSVTIDAAILGATLTGSGVTKTYDGTTAPVGFTASYSYTGLVAGDTGATLAYTGAAYDSAHVSAASKITLTGLSVTGIAGSTGSLASDYSLDASSKDVAATITARTLTATLNNTGVTKVYDGSVTPAGFIPTYDITGFASGDSGATVNHTGAAYDSAHVVGASKITVSGMSLGAIAGADGSLASDYALDAASKDVAASISARTVALSASKTYDSSLALTGAVSVATGVAGESLGYSGATGNDANVATAGKFIDAITLQDGTGGLASDYQLPTLDAAHAALTITPKTVSISANKTYDGNTALDGTVTIDTGIAGQALGYSGAAASDAHVATAGKYIDSIVLADGLGGDSSNYQLPLLSAAGAGNSVTINAAVLGATLTNSGVTKTYDGTAAPVGFIPAYSFAGLVGGDTAATLANTGAAYDSSHVQDASKITVSGLSISAIAGSAGSQASDYVLDATSKDVAAAITARSLSATLSNTGVSKVYDGSTTPVGLIATYNFGGLAAGDTGATLAYTGAAYDSAHVAAASKITLTGLSVTGIAGSTGSLASDYSLDASSKDVAATITARTLTATLNNTGVTKVYDGSVTPAGFIPTYDITGFASGDSGATVNHTGAAYDSAHVVGASKITVSGMSLGAIAGIDGSLASDYALDAASKDVAASIGARTVALSASKTYDSSLALAAAVSVATGVAGESLGYSGATGNDANVATAGKFIDAITLQDGTGGLASDYRLPTLDAAHAALTITPKTVSISATKTYDAGTALDGKVTIATGIAGQALGYSGAVASDANVATGGKYVSAITLEDGATGLASNYALPLLGSASAPVVITPYGVNLNAFRAYDGSTVLDASVFNFGALPGGETLTLSGSGSIADQHAGTGKAVTLETLALSDGTGLASNYTLAGSVNTATIGKAQLTATASVASRSYDGSTNATLNGLSLTGFVSGETVLAVSAGTTSFADKYAATGKIATVTGIGLLDGVHGLASDYSVAATATALANIAKVDLNVAGVVALDKVYDGTASANINARGAVLTGKLGGDDVSVGTISGTFADKNVGVAKAVTGSAFVLSGADAVNYNLIQPTGLVASITPRSLVVSADALDKVYDAGTAASVNLSDNRIAGDTLTIGSQAAFLDKNAGVNKFVSVSGITLSGADAGNYSANPSSAAFANIAKAVLSVNATAQSKVYDGSTAASVALTDNRIAGDALSLSYGSAAFADKNAGVGKTVTVGGISLGGADAGNYSVDANAAALATISKKTLSVNATGQDKVYDGATAASVTLGDNRIAGDALSLSYGSAAFADKNAGVGKTVMVGGISLGGADAGNYSVDTNAAALATISKKTLSVNATGQDKVYDATTAASVTLGDNRVAGDALSLSFGSAAFADKNAGVGKTVTVGGISLGGADAGNYSIASTASGTASITPKSLTASALGFSKVYDGNTTAAFLLSDDRVAGDSVVLSANANFSDAKAGTAKAINVSNIRISGGTDSGNYVLANAVAAAIGDITALSDTWVLPAPAPMPGPAAPQRTLAPQLAPQLPGLALPSAAAWLDLQLPAGFGEAGDSDADSAGDDTAPKAQAPLMLAQAKAGETGVQQ